MKSIADVYELITTIFNQALEQIQRGLYDGGQSVFNNEFFNVALALSIVYIGYMIAFRKLQDEEIAYKVVWTLVVFVVVKTVLFDKEYYDYLIEVVNIPRDIFTSMIYNFTSSINADATIENIIKNISLAVDSLANTIFAQGSWNNISAYIYAFIVWVSGMFLLLVILLNTVISIFLSDLILALLPFIVIFLIWKRTEYIFFSWVKLYVSISLYAPFTMLFGLVTVMTAEVSMDIAQTLQSDFKNNTELIFALVLVQAITALGIFKIPNIINQLIGSSNEGSSLTSGVGTISAGATMMAGVSKYTGMSFAGKQASSLGKAGARKVGDKIRDTVKDKVSFK